MNLNLSPFASFQQIDRCDFICVDKTLFRALVYDPMYKDIRDQHLKFRDILFSEMAFELALAQMKNEQKICDSDVGHMFSRGNGKRSKELFFLYLLQFIPIEDDCYGNDMMHDQKLVEAMVDTAEYHKCIEHTFKVLLRYSNQPLENGGICFRVSLSDWKG